LPSPLSHPTRPNPLAQIFHHLLTNHPRPNFTITFVRTPSLPPTWATFITPLSLNKLDIRDYLWHAYGVHSLRVRSYVVQRPVQRTSTRRMFRGRGYKRMTVEMDKPFVWPDEPEDYSPYVYVVLDGGVG
jgi:large subunit ribosomal protein L23